MFGKFIGFSLAVIAAHHKCTRRYLAISCVFLVYLQEQQNDSVFSDTDMLLAAEVAKHTLYAMSAIDIIVIDFKSNISSPNKPKSKIWHFARKFVRYAIMILLLHQDLGDLS